VPNNNDYSEFKIIDILVGKSHILLLTENGEVYAYGDNSYGQLGYKSEKNCKENSEEWDFSVNYSNKLKLVRFSGLGNENFKIKQIATGGYHCLALTDTGDIFGWGRNNVSQLGMKHQETLVFKPSLLLTLTGTPIRQITAYFNTTYKGVFEICLTNLVQKRPKRLKTTWKWQKFSKITRNDQKLPFSDCIRS